MRKTTANIRFVPVMVTFSLGDSWFVPSSMLIESFELRNPPERKA